MSTSDIRLVQHCKINNNDIHAKIHSVGVALQNYSSTSFGPHISLL